jgi:tetrahydrodipicolinate N-succinyltransferase
LLNEVGDKPKNKTTEKEEEDDDDDETDDDDEEETNIIIKPEDQQQPKLKEVYFLLSCLSPCYCDNYDKWLKVAIIIFNEVNDYELLDAFSQRSKRYNAVNNLKIWNSFKSSCNQLRIASLKMYAKESNPEKYAKYYK